MSAKMHPRVMIQQSLGATGKTTRAIAWQKQSPSKQRIVEGDREEANRLAQQGCEVMLNLLPGM